MCTDFILPFDPESPLIVSGRTLDFTAPDPAFLLKSPIGYQETSLPNKWGIQWANQYGFVAICTMDGDVKRANDGMNTEGLSVASLWLVYTDLDGDGVDFQETDSANLPEADYLNVANLVAYLLGTCASVEEVPAALDRVIVWNHQKPSTTHMAIHDKNGKSLVVEFIKGKKVYYDNKIGVLTNGPAYDWQAIHFNFYYNSLTPKNNALDQYVEFAGHAAGIQQASRRSALEYEVLGRGLFGMPGDSTSPSRFVRTGKLRDCFPPTSAKTDLDKQKGIQHVLQVLGRISVCEQEVQLHFDGDGNPYGPHQQAYSFTHWKIARNHTDLIYFYCTHLNQNLQAIKLRELDFENSTVSQTPLFSDAPWYDDVTEQLQ